MEKDPIFQLADNIREASYELHQFLRHGHLEKVYENGLVNRLKLRGISALQQHPIPVRDFDGTSLGDFIADLFVDDQMIVELKAADTLAGEHTAQLLGYLRASGVEHGLLINFGAPKLQIKKYILSPEE